MLVGVSEVLLVAVPWSCLRVLFGPWLERGDIDLHRDGLVALSPESRPGRR